MFLIHGRFERVNTQSDEHNNAATRDHVSTHNHTGLSNTTQDSRDTTQHTWRINDTMVCGCKKLDSFKCPRG